MPSEIHIKWYPHQFSSKRQGKSGRIFINWLTISKNWCVKIPAKNIIFALIFFLLLLIGNRASAFNNLIVIEFLYFFSPCPKCTNDVYHHNVNVLNNIKIDYGDKILVRWIPFFSEEGERKRDQYGIEIWNQNAIVINYEVVITGYANESYVRELIDYYIGVKPFPPSPQQVPSPLQSDFGALLTFAFIFGLLETFSPCLVIMLSFLLCYTIGEPSSFSKKFLRVMTFGAGFILATLFMFFATIALVGITPMFYTQQVLMWVVCTFAVLLGLDLLGINILGPFKIENKVKPLIRRLTKTFAFTYAGLAMIGFLFYFLDPCTAPIFVTLMATSEYALIFRFLPIILFMFCMGAVIPFICISFLSASISKLARSTYRHRSKIRKISGAILISYVLYIIVLYFSKVY